MRLPAAPFSPPLVSRFLDLRGARLPDQRTSWFALSGGGVAAAGVVVSRGASALPSASALVVFVDLSVNCGSLVHLDGVAFPRISSATCGRGVAGPPAHCSQCA